MCIYNYPFNIGLKQLLNVNIVWNINDFNEGQEMATLPFFVNLELQRLAYFEELLNMFEERDWDQEKNLLGFSYPMHHYWHKGVKHHSFVCANN